MALTDWINTASELFAITVENTTVQTYKFYPKSNFPESIRFVPTALSFPINVTYKYSTSGTIAIWEGVTEFHLIASVSKRHYSVVAPYFHAILVAIAGNITLDGKVSYFRLRPEGGTSIDGPVILRYGSESPHIGLVVHWIVKELEEITVA